MQGAEEAKYLVKRNYAWFNQSTITNISRFDPCLQIRDSLIYLTFFLLLFGFFAFLWHLNELLFQLLIY